MDGDWTQRGESKSLHCDSRFGGSWQVGKGTEKEEQDAAFVCSGSDTKRPRASRRGNKRYGLVRSCDFTADMGVTKVFQIILHSHPFFSIPTIEHRCFIATITT